MSPRELRRQSLSCALLLGFWIVFGVFISCLGMLPAPVAILTILATLGLLILMVLDMRNRPVTVQSSIKLYLNFPSGESVTPEYVASLLTGDTVSQIIKQDLLRTDQLGRKERWSLCLITSERDRFDPRGFWAQPGEDIGAQVERAWRLDLWPSVHVKRSAALYRSKWGDNRPNNLLITAGNSDSSHRLSTKTRAGEFTPIRDLRVRPASARGKSADLPGFLRESGFPLRQAYGDADPLTADRGGTIVSDRGRLIVIYPNYFVQRRVIDEDGELIYLGLNENYGYRPDSSITMGPATSEWLLEWVSDYRHVPIVRYRSFPYASDFLLPLLDTPMRANGWADLIIDPRGRAKLFVAKERTPAQWSELEAEIRELLYSEVVKKDYHLLGLTRDPTHLNEYLTKKQAILAKHYHIDDLAL